MLKNLHIENYALIEQLDMDFHTGFSVITGETGAGKSIIIGAIGLLLGQRADMRAIKTGAKRCVVEATFDVTHHGLEDFFEEHDLDFDGSECIVRRELTATGKSRAFINDTPATLAQLKEVGDRLVDVHSQHKNLLLGKEDFQLNVIDIVAKQQALLHEYRKEYEQYRRFVRELHEAEEAVKRSRDDEDYLRFQADQLAEADLREGEQEELEEEGETLTHAEEIKSALYGATARIQSSTTDLDVLSALKQSADSLRAIARVYAPAGELAERLDTCRIELKDVADELEGQAEDVECDPKRLERVDERLNLIYTLQKKHGVDTVKELLDIQKDLEQQLDSIDNSDAHLAELRKQMETQRKRAEELAKKLSKGRAEAASKVEKEMRERLLPLGMPNVQFRCSVTAHPDELTETGCDQVQFLFNANLGGELCPVSQIASGGEIARVMLALKTMVAGEVRLPTVVFDEIDTGVSGSVAEKMAVMMKEMGTGERQVISITHLPQIAAQGHHHYRVYKEDNDSETLSHIIEISPEERVEEIAHMLSGETLTQAAVDNARALLRNAHPDNE